MMDDRRTSRGNGGEAVVTETERRMLETFDQVLAWEESIPDHLVRLAQEFYTWRDVDSEMLELLVDSARDELVLVRSDSLQRFMAFGNNDRGVHFECQRQGSGFSVQGAVVPDGIHEVRAHRTGQDDVVTATDSLGSFTFDGLDKGSMRFTIRLEDGQTIRTPWFTLES
jgi:hypothetical protein